MSLKNIPTLKAFDIIPQGSNGLKTRDRYSTTIDYERYFNNFLLKNNLSSSVFFDSRYDDQDYGKIDQNGNVVILDTLNIKDLELSLDIFALPFVVDAFKNLQTICNLYGKNGTFTDKSLGNLNPRSGLMDVGVLYHNHMNGFYNIFISYIQEKRKNITNFNDFLKYFIMFLKEFCDKTSFLKSSFCVNNCPVNITGLSVEIDDLPKDKDINKYLKYFNSNNFNDFQLLCQAHSFKIDKYCPWRLVFDLNNPNSKKYLTNYNLDKNNLFEKYFIKSIDYDIDNVILYLIMFFNNYINKNEILEKTEIKTNNNETYIEKTTINKFELMEYMSVKKMYPDYFWYQLYFYILLLEFRVDINQQQYEQLVRSSAIKASLEGLYPAVLSFIDDIKIYKKTNTKKFNFFG